MFNIYQGYESTYPWYGSQNPTTSFVNLGDSVVLSITRQGTPNTRAIFRFASNGSKESAAVIVDMELDHIGSEYIYWRFPKKIVFQMRNGSCIVDVFISSVVDEILAFSENEISHLHCSYFSKHRMKRCLIDTVVLAYALSFFKDSVAQKFGAT